MVILDVLAVILLYAFVVPYVWISLTFVIAAFRVRRGQPRKRILGLLGHALYSLWYAFWPVYALFLLRDSSELWFRVTWYLLVFIYPILLVSRLQLTNKVTPLWRKVGYAELKELLLFRPPSGEPLADDLILPDSVGSTDRRILWIVAGLSLCVLGLSSLGIGLQTCQWLDIATGRSGCLRTLSFDFSGSVEEIAFSPDGRVMAASIWNGLLQFTMRLMALFCGSCPDNKVAAAKVSLFRPITNGSPLSLLMITRLRLGMWIQANWSIPWNRLPTHTRSNFRQTADTSW